MLADIKFKGRNTKGYEYMINDQRLLHGGSPVGLARPCACPATSTTNDKKMKLSID